MSLKLAHWLVELVLQVDYVYKVNTVSVQLSERYRSLLRLQCKSDILIYIIKINGTSTVISFSKVVEIQLKQNKTK